MFIVRNYRYISSGVVNNIEDTTQLAMWQLIDALRIRKDYLQAFELSRVNMNGIELQQIVHYQEQPEYEELVFIPALHPVNLVVM